MHYPSIILSNPLISPSESSRFPSPLPQQVSLLHFVISSLNSNRVFCMRMGKMVICWSGDQALVVYQEGM